MAEEESSSQEKTEDPTPKRLEKAREEGQTARSRELTTTAILLAGTLGLLAFGGFIASRLAALMRFNLSLEREKIFDTKTMIIHLSSSFGDALISLLPLFGVLAIAAILGPIALGGWLVSSKAMAPKLSRMSPIQGLKRMFSLKSLVELGKALAKVILILCIAIAILWNGEAKMLALSNQAVEPAIFSSLQIGLWAAITLSAVTIIIALIDIPFQIWDHSQKLKMSRQDIKDEMKDSEGKPEVKSRIRQLQREMANRRMMEKVPDADVIITNPEHYAVALKYDPDTMTTPILLAKGVDRIALKIREIASVHKIEVLESPLLARSIYHTTELDEEIPGGLYLAVAQVLAYVFQLRNFYRGQGNKPQKPTKLDIPKELRY